mmetsp:Transcript_2776/g.5703  ORF Transcript_2776/g.5703 Transcript_2776/m.5703 type:complete len:200 (-) Transcript_2776:346-945(-)
MFTMTEFSDRFSRTLRFRSEVLLIMLACSSALIFSSNLKFSSLSSISLTSGLNLLLLNLPSVGSWSFLFTRSPLEIPFLGFMKCSFPLEAPMTAPDIARLRVRGGVGPERSTKLPPLTSSSLCPAPETLLLSLVSDMENAETISDLSLSSSTSISSALYLIGSPDFIVFRLILEVFRDAASTSVNFLFCCCSGLLSLLR